MQGRSLRVGIIGFGTIGRAVAEAIGCQQAGSADLRAVFVRDLARLRPDDRTRFGDIFRDDFDQFLAAELDWAIEAGGHAALRQWGPRALAAAVSLLTVSAGALADPAFCQALSEAAGKAGRQVVVPSGAIGALDVLSSAAVGRLDEVRLTTRKPPRALLAPDEADRITTAGAAQLLFSGPAREAARRFPENLNVCAALGLAGIGLDRTQVSVYADPSVDKNTHQVSARGYFGEFQLTLNNIPTETNPKTGRVTALSIIKTLRNLTSPLVIGS